jgi:hypothetical protein
LGVIALIWWESKTQEELLKNSKMISYWYEFIVELKNKFYHLGYMQQAIMDWRNLRKNIGKNVKDCTQELIKMELTLGIPLYT